MQTERSRRTPALVLLVTGLAGSGAAAADDLYSAFQTPHADWSLLAGATRTDNATLAPSGPSDTIAMAGFGGSLYRDTEHLKADLDGLVYYENYLGGTYSSDVLGHFNGRVSYAFVPERFTWVVEDGFGQVNANPALPTTPFNRVNGNILSTGPDGYLRFGSDVGLTLGARYSQSNYQSNYQSNTSAYIDDQTLTGNLGLIKHLSQAAALSLNATVARIEYRAPGSPGYDQVEVFGRYETRNARSGIALDAGTSKLRDTVTGSVVQDPLLRLTFFHRLTPSWNVNLSAGQQYENTSTALQGALSTTQVVNGQVVPSGTGSAPAGTGGVTANVFPTQSPFRSDYLRAAFDFVRPRTTVDLHGSFERQRYQFAASGLELDVRGGGASFHRQVRPSLSFHAAVDYERQASAEGFPGYQSKLADVGLDWRAGAMLAVTVAYHREDRKADAGGYPYLVNQIYLGLSYGPPKRGISFQPPGQTTPGTAIPGP
jgi:hypothetical protein